MNRRSSAVILPAAVGALGLIVLGCGVEASVENPSSMEAALCKDPPCTVPIPEPEDPSPSPTPVPTPTPRPVTSVFAGTYNIHSGKNGANVYDIQKTATAIATDLAVSGVEVVALQEVGCSGTLGSLVTAPFLNSRYRTLRYYYPYAIQYNDNGYSSACNLAILSKYPHDEPRVIYTNSVLTTWPNAAPTQRLATLVVRIHAPGGDFDFYNVHLQNDGFNWFGTPVSRAVDRYQQALDIARHINLRTSSVPVFVLGDFNAPETEWDIAPLASFLAGPTKATSIDYEVCVDRNQSPCVIDYGLSTWGSYSEQSIRPNLLGASDHPPAWFRWRQ